MLIPHAIINGACGAIDCTENFLKRKIKLKNSVKFSTESVGAGAALASEDRRSEQRFITVNRSYKLKCYPTITKSEIARYTINRFNTYLNENIQRMWSSGGRYESTKGKGQLYSKAQYRAKGIITATRKSSKALNRRPYMPCVERMFTRVRLEESKNSSFDYFVLVENLFEKSKLVRLPVKSHGVLNKTLKNNWKLSEWADLHYDKEKKEFYVQVFVEKKVEKAKETNRFIGVDVGLNHAYSSSDGYHSPGLKSLRRRMNKRIADRARYKTEKIKQTTTIKQRLNQYAKEIVNRVNDSERGLAFERPVIIGRLSRKRLQGWAGAYLANRTNILARELSVYVHEVNPAYTSQICPRCSYKDKRNRNGVNFSCRHCGHKCHADFVGAINIARRASGEVKLNPATLAARPKREARAL